jgi:hypothetical protein
MSGFGCTINQYYGSRYNEVEGSRSGMAKMAHKKVKINKNSMF